MRLSLSLAVCALLLATSASAELRVMCYGDSITAGTDPNPENSYPGQLQALRPDLQVLNEGRGGDVSDNVDRFREALATDQPNVVVLMLGTNDAVCVPGVLQCASPTATPERSAENVLAMAAEARSHGADVIILTPPPALCIQSCKEHGAEFSMAVRDAFTGRLAEELLRARPPAGVRVANLRGAFTADSWADLSRDGLHPTTAGNVVIAKFVAARIPQRGARQSAHEPAAARVADEPHPFARHPAPTPAPH